MFYLDENEEAIRTRFNTLSFYFLIASYILSFYLLDRTYKNVWIGFPIAIFTYIILRFLIYRRKAGSSPPFYKNKSKAIKLLIFALFCNFCFFSLQYLAHAPILNQHFLPANMTMDNYIQYTGPDSGSENSYWSFQFSIQGQDLKNNAIFSERFENEDKFDLDPASLINKEFVGCGCGVEYGSWGDIALNPSFPFRYYEDKDGIPGIKLPTWLALCFGRESCEKKYTGTDVDYNTTYKLFYRIVGDPKLALENDKCPPKSMNFLQVNREEFGTVPNDEVVLSFLFAFSTSMASGSLLLALGLISLTENYGNRITFIVLNSMTTIGLELTVLVREDFIDDLKWKFIPFVICFLGSGYIYFIILKGDIWKIIFTFLQKFRRIFKYTGDSEKTIMKILSSVWKVLWFLIGCPWALFQVIVILWIKGRCKIFALKPFKLSEDKYSLIYDKKDTRKKNKIFNIITIIDVVVFRCGAGAILLHLLLTENAKEPLVMTVTLVFVLYDFLSCMYPLVKQALILKGVNNMLESLNPRYYNMAIIKRERTLKTATVKRGRRGSDESIQLQNRRELDIIYHT